jgi:hypothetical protein
MLWEMPVFVGKGNQLTGAVAGPRQAIEYMQSNFRFQDGETYVNAWTGCHDAVAGRIGLAIARKLFVTAFVRDSVRSSMGTKKVKSVPATAEALE